MDDVVTNFSHPGDNWVRRRKMILMKFLPKSLSRTCQFWFASLRMGSGWCLNCDANCWLQLLCYFLHFNYWKFNFPNSCGHCVTLEHSPRWSRALFVQQQGLFVYLISAPDAAPFLQWKNERNSVYFQVSDNYHEALVLYVSLLDLRCT